MSGGVFCCFSIPLIIDQKLQADSVDPNQVFATFDLVWMPPVESLKVKDRVGPLCEERTVALPEFVLAR